MKRIVISFVIVWLLGQAVCPGAETAVVDFKLFAEFEGRVKPGEGIPAGTVTFTHRKGVWNTSITDWEEHGSGQYWKTAEEAVPLDIKEDSPLIFTCDYDEELPEFEIGGTSIKFDPPPWATVVIQNQNIDSKPKTWFKWDGVWVRRDNQFEVIIRDPAQGELPYFEFDTGRSTMTLTFSSSNKCKSCKDCEASPSASPPSLSTGDSGSISLSAPLPLGNACCEDKARPNRLNWTPVSISSATDPATLQMDSYDLIAGLATRYPTNPALPLQQIKIGTSLGVVVSASGSLIWKVYDATDIGAPNGSGQYPLTKASGGPLPLVEQISITQEAPDTVLFQSHKAGNLVSQYRVIHSSTQNTWQREDILAGSRETKAITVEGAGFRITEETFEKNRLQVWKKVSSRSRHTQMINNAMVVTTEYEGGDQVATHGYYPDGKRKWTLREDGSWNFIVYDSFDERTIYSPFLDTPFPGASWDPTSPATSLAGLKRVQYGLDSEYRSEDGKIVYQRSGSTVDVGLYAETRSETVQGRSSTTTAVTLSDSVFEGFRGKVLFEDDGRGIATFHEYTRGTVDSSGFAPASAGNYVMEVVTRGKAWEALPDLVLYDSQSLVPHPQKIGASFPDAATREVYIYNPDGQAIYSGMDVLDGGSYALGVTAKVWTREEMTGAEGAVTTETRDGRIVSVHSEFSDGTWESTMDEAGSVTEIERDKLGRVTKETSPGPTVGSFIVRNHVYDGLTTRTTTTGGGISLVTEKKRDLRGRLISFADETGAVTNYKYPSGSPGRQAIRLNTIVEESTHYLDGRFKERSGSAVIREYATYQIDSSGNEIETRSTGSTAPLTHSQRTTVTTRNADGETLSLTKPGPPMPVSGRYPPIIMEIDEHYDSASGKNRRIITSSATSVYDISESDLLGVTSAAGTAADSGILGAEGPSSTDRFSTTTLSYQKRGSHFWAVRTTVTPVSSSVSLTTSSATRLWRGTGEVTECTDSAGNVTQTATAFDTSSRTRVETTTHSTIAGSAVSTFTNGYLESRSVAGASLSETFGYDGLGRQIRRKDVRNAVTRSFYNAVGQLEKVVDHLGQSVHYTYYPSNHLSTGRVWKRTDAAGKVTEMGYDPKGRVNQTGGSAAYPVAYLYDSYGALESMTTYGTVTATTTWVYDGPTGLLQKKKFHGQSDGIEYKYRADGRTASRKWRRGVTTAYDYSVFGDLKQIDQPGASTYALFANFDRLGRPTSVTEASGTTSLAYDPQTGEMSNTYANAHSLLPGISLSISLADAGRLGGYTLAQHGQPASLMAVSYDYDETGHLETIQSGNNTVDYQYYPGTGIVHQTTHSLTDGAIPRIETRHVDLGGRTTGITTTVPKVGGGRSVSASAGYLYNPSGQRERLTREDGSSWQYGYNDRAEVISAVKKFQNGDVAGGMQFGYKYDAIGNREWAKSGGNSSEMNLRTTTYEPNALNQYKSVTTPSSFDVLVGSTTSVQVLADGLPAPVSNQGNFHRADVTANNTTNGAWVDLNISSASGSKSGHRWVPPASFNPGQDESGNLNHYDKDGNLLTDGRWTYVWDNRNRLTSMTTTQTAFDLGVPKQKLEFSYDWNGRRLGKKVLSWSGSTWTVVEDLRFVYDGWNLIAEFQLVSGSLSVSRTYLWGLDLSHTPQGSGGVGGLLAANTVNLGASTSYPAYDGNGSIIAWTSADGEILQRNEWDPFGTTLVQESVPSFVAPPFGFSTKYRDSQSGLIYYGFRYYDPVVGRWQSRDPVGETGGTNVYAFVGNNGIRNVDVLGLVDYKEGDSDPNYTPDEGSGEWDSVDVGWGDLLKKHAAIRAALGFMNAFDGYPNAKAHMRHFLGNTGSKLPVDLGSMTNASPTGIAAYQSELNVAKLYAESLTDGDHRFTSGATSVVANPKAETGDWYYAVGSYHVWGKGRICKEGDWIWMEFEYKFKDRYNWDGSKSVSHKLEGKLLDLYNAGAGQIPDDMAEYIHFNGANQTITVSDEALQLLHRQGLAREFDMDGSFKKSYHWKRGEPIAEAKPTKPAKPEPSRWE